MRESVCDRENTNHLNKLLSICNKVQHSNGKLIVLVTTPYHTPEDTPSTVQASTVSVSTGEYKFGNMAMS